MMYFGYMLAPNLMHQGRTINREKSYKDLYNLYATQIQTTKCTSEALPTEDIIKPKKSKCFQSFNLKTQHVWAL